MIPWRYSWQTLDDGRQANELGDCHSKTRTSWDFCSDDLFARTNLDTTKYSGLVHHRNVLDVQWIKVREDDHGKMFEMINPQTNSLSELRTTRFHSSEQVKSSRRMIPIGHMHNAYSIITSFIELNYWRIERSWRMYCFWRKSETKIWMHMLLVARLQCRGMNRFVMLLFVKSVRTLYQTVCTITDGTPT
jgi:hypothetical protein